MSPNSNQQPIARNKAFDVTQQMLNRYLKLTHQKESAVSGEDFAGQYNRPGKNIIHTPNWVGGDFTVNGVKLLIYNIREL